MFSTDELYSSAQSISADGESTNALSHADGAEGVEVAVVCTAFAPTSVDVWLLENTADSGWDITDADQVVASVQFTGTGREILKGYVRKAYSKLYFDHTGTGAAVFTAGPVPAGQRDNYNG